MMTPSELREHEFKGAGRNAYKADDVDAFFGDVAVAYEKMYRENGELIKRVSLLADRLEHFKQDEYDIKQAVIGAQKAADLIVKDAEESVENSKNEAEAILAAAKGEADIIKSDAEKQAVADSELLLSIARDKAEDILNKAKEEAHGILIAANDSASDTVGAATRTITSESIHYDMLKKEVSDFRASILAQYKAHIELISKLPELAVEEAEKLQPTADSTEAREPENVIEEAIDTDASCENEALEYTAEPLSDTINEEASSVDEQSEPDSSESESESSFSQEIEDLISDSTEENNDSTEISSADFAPVDSEPADIPISKGFKFDFSNVDADDLMSFSDDSNEEAEDTSDLFDSIQKIDSVGIVDEEDDESDLDEEAEDKKPHRSFFRRKK